MALVDCSTDDVMNKKCNAKSFRPTSLYFLES
jgi:hypothetical protein